MIESEKIKRALIVDEAYLPGQYSRLHKHYTKGTIVTIKSEFYGLVEIEVSKTISTITLMGEDLKAIEVIAE